MPLPDGASKSSVKAVFHTGSLRLAFDEQEGPALNGRLGGQCDVDGCTWSIDGGSVVVTLEKAGEVSWGSLFV